MEEEYAAWELGCSRLHINMQAHMACLMWRLAADLEWRGKAYLSASGAALQLWQQNRIGAAFAGREYADAAAFEEDGHLAWMLL